MGSVGVVVNVVEKMRSSLDFDESARGIHGGVSQQAFTFVWAHIGQLVRIMSVLTDVLLDKRALELVQRRGCRTEVRGHGESPAWRSSKLRAGSPPATRMGLREDVGRDAERGTRSEEHTS